MGSTILEGTVREGQDRKVAFEQRLEGHEEASHVSVVIENVPGRRLSQCSTHTLRWGVPCRS